MDELIEQIAAAQGFPADLVRRTAGARAQAAGVTMEDILRQWAGGDAAPAAAPAATPAAPAPAPAAAAQTADPPPAPKGPEVEVLAAEEPAEAMTPEAEAEAESRPSPPCLRVRYSQASRAGSPRRSW